MELEFEDNAAVCVVLASDGYPEHYEKGYPISGLERFKDADGYFVFHAGTKLNDQGRSSQTAAGCWASQPQEAISKRPVPMLTRQPSGGIWE